MSEAGKLNIKAWAEEDRPREKLLAKGRTALSDSELLAILIGSGTTEKTAVDLCKEILASVGNNLDKLARLGVKDLMRFKGIGEAKAITIVAALELGRRKKDSGKEPIKKITSSKDAFDYLKPWMIDLNHEVFFVILLARNNTIIKHELISSGGISGTIVDAKLIFKSAIDNLASGIILAHNHPSGNLKPSEQDISLTKRIKAGAALLDLTILDHLIFTNKDYFSFADEGKM